MPSPCLCRPVRTVFPSLSPQNKPAEVRVLFFSNLLYIWSSMSCFFEAERRLELGTVNKKTEDQVTPLRRILTSSVTLDALKNPPFLGGRRAVKGRVNPLLPSRSLCTFQVFKYIGVRQLEPPSLGVLWPPAGRKAHATLRDSNLIAGDGRGAKVVEGGGREGKDGVSFLTGLHRCSRGCYRF